MLLLDSQNPYNIPTNKVFCFFTITQSRFLGQAERRLADFALNAIPARLDRLLADFSDRYGVPDRGGVLIDIPLPHREIASIVGSTRESVTVRLNAMRREGTIEFVNRRILVKRPESLVREISLASKVANPA